MLVDLNRTITAGVGLGLRTVRGTSFCLIQLGPKTGGSLGEMGRPSSCRSIKEVADAKAIEIQKVYEAIKKADPSDKLVQLKSLEALEEVAKGEANKVFIPFEATNALSSLGSMAEVIKDNKTKADK